MHLYKLTGISRFSRQMRIVMELQLGQHFPRLHPSTAIEENCITNEVIDVFIVFQWKVVGLATYSYFIACCIARQNGGPISICLPSGNSTQNSNSTCSANNDNYIELYIPVQTILEFLFYMGLLKVSWIIWL